MNTNRIFSTIGIFLLILGILLGSIINVALNWPSFETFYYFKDTPRDFAELKTLECPRVISRSEEATVKVRLYNPSDQPLKSVILLDVARPVTMRSERLDNEIPGGGSWELEWKISDADIIFGQFIMTSVHVYKTFIDPARHGFCGILVLPIRGIAGETVMYSSLAISLLLLGIGLAFWLKASSTQTRRQVLARWGFLGLVALVVLGLAATFFGAWPIGGFLLIMTILLGVAFATYIIQSA